MAAAFSNDFEIVKSLLSSMIGYSSSAMDSVNQFSSEISVPIAHRHLLGSTPSGTEPF